MSTRDQSGTAPQHNHPHNNTLSRNENFWVDQVTVPHAPPWEGQGVGKDKGGGGNQTPMQQLSKQMLNVCPIPPMHIIVRRAL